MAEKLELKQVVGEVEKDGLVLPSKLVNNPRFGLTVNGKSPLPEGVQLPFPGMVHLIDPDSEEEVSAGKRRKNNNSPGLVEKIRFEEPIPPEEIKPRRIGKQPNLL